jgi:hypothetical protein
LVVSRWSKQSAFSHPTLCGDGRPGRPSGAKLPIGARHQKGEGRSFAGGHQNATLSTRNLPIITCSERRSRRRRPTDTGLVLSGWRKDWRKIEAEDLHEPNIAEMGSRYCFLDIVSTVAWSGRALSVVRYCLARRVDVASYRGGCLRCR